MKFKFQDFFYAAGAGERQILVPVRFSKTQKKEYREEFVCHRKQYKNTLQQEKTIR